MTPSFVTDNAVTTIASRITVRLATWQLTTGHCERDAVFGIFFHCRLLWCNDVGHIFIRNSFSSSSGLQASRRAGQISYRARKIDKIYKDLSDFPTEHCDDCHSSWLWCQTPLKLRSVSSRLHGAVHLQTCRCNNMKSLILSYKHVI